MSPYHKVLLPQELVTKIPPKFYFVLRILNFMETCYQPTTNVGWSRFYF